MGAAFRRAETTPRGGSCLQARWRGVHSPHPPVVEAASRASSPAGVSSERRSTASLHRALSQSYMHCRHDMCQKCDETNARYEYGTSCAGVRIKCDVKRYWPSKQPICRISTNESTCMSIKIVRTLWMPRSILVMGNDVSSSARWIYLLVAVVLCSYRNLGLQVRDFQSNLCRYRLFNQRRAADQMICCWERSKENLAGWGFVQRDRPSSPIFRLQRISRRRKGRFLTSMSPRLTCFCLFGE